MGCKSCGSAGLNDEQISILSALNDFSEPAGTKDIAEKTGIEAQKLASKISALKKKGYIDTPVRCKYSITDQGRAEIA